MSKTLVIIPTLNEIENIREIIEAVLQLNQGYHLLIVDDNSQDGTAQAVEAIMENEPMVFLEKRIGAKGLGTAYIHGFKWALARDYEYIIEMDADFSHNPKDVPKLLSQCQYRGSDVAVGSRYINNKVNVINWEINRLLLSYFASKYVRFITQLPVFDTTAGFVCYHRKVLEAFNLDNIKFVGYAFQIEMKYKAWKKGFQIDEVPIIFTDRARGSSKMNSAIVREGIFGVIQMRFFKDHQ